jgi:hypothetical protein
VKTLRTAAPNDDRNTRFVISKGQRVNLKAVNPLRWVI